MARYSNCRAAGGFGRFTVIAERPAFPFGTTIRCGDDVRVSLASYFAMQDREHFVALLLDARHLVVGWHLVSVGTLTTSLCSPREVFRVALMAGAAAVILAHNHPSGDPTPSLDDIQVTQMLTEAGRLVDMPVLDHLVFGNQSYVSIVELAAVNRELRRREES